MLFLSVLFAAGCNEAEPTETTGTWEGPGDACLSCHEGIEPVHPEPVAADDCTACHGGDDRALTKRAAHVAPPDDYLEIRGDGLPIAPEG